MSGGRTKLKILCLHGFCQNGKIFRERTGAIRRALKGVAEFSFVDAPHEVDKRLILGAAAVEGRETEGDGTEGEEGMGKELGWWTRTPPTQHCSGVGQSLRELTAYWRENGPFDGVFGFSQGASMASLLCVLSLCREHGIDEETMIERIDYLMSQVPEEGERVSLSALLSSGANRNEANIEGIRVKLAMFVSGFEPRILEQRGFYQQEQFGDIGSLHVYGESDQQIPADMSKKLLEKFRDALSISHEGGHYMPANGAQRKLYKEFFSRVRDELYPSA
eukprot:Nk52_evm81s1444 gene=Nk52_evmTU81s1444